MSFLDLVDVRICQQVAQEFILGDGSFLLIARAVQFLVQELLILLVLLHILLEQLS